MNEIKFPLGDAVFSITTEKNGIKCSSKWKTTSHFHSNNEIHIVLHGSAIVETDGEDIKINCGEICLLAPNLSHYPKSSSDDLLKVNFAFNIAKNYNYFNSEKTFSEYAYYYNVFKSVKNYTLINEPDLIKTISEIMNMENTETNEHVLQTTIASFMIKLASAIKKHCNLSDEQVAQDVYENESNFNQRKAVEEFFHQRYCDQVGIKDLAKVLCLSVPQTHRIVKKIFNVGFKKTLMKQRIAHACMLIKRGGVSIDEVSLLCGYESYNGFLSAFKSLTGKTPKEYEKT